MSAKVLEPVERAPRKKRWPDEPRITRTDEVVTYWAERIRAVNPSPHDRADKDSMSMHGDRIYHYGHFTLAEILRDHHGRARLVLVNGDTWGPGGWGPSTSSRQGDVRRACARECAGTNVQVLVVPFSVLRAAGIEQDSIRVVEVRPDRTTYHDFESNEAPGRLLKMPDPTGATYTHEAERWGFRNEAGEIWRGIGNAPEGFTYGHYTVPEERAVFVDNPNEAEAPSIAHGWPTGPAKRGEDGVWRWTVSRHWLGDSLIRACVRGRKTPRLFLSSFDYQEPRAPYFFCELPASSRAKSVEEGIEDLKPDSVAQACASGVEVLRQGDVFAIPTSYTTDELKSRAVPHEWTEIEHEWSVSDDGTYTRIDSSIPRSELIRSLKRDGSAAMVLKTNHGATHVIVTRDGETFARGRLYHRPAWRDPDHRTVNLGDRQTWYRLVKNTVPEAKGRTRQSSGWGPQQSGQSRAWTLGGQVD